MQKPRWRQIGFAIGIWVFIAVLFSGLLYLTSVQIRPERIPGWRNIFLWQAIIYAWAILFPVISWFARLFPFERRNWQRVLPLHLLAAVVFTFLHTVIYVFSYHLYEGFFSPEESRFFATIKSNFLSNWALDSSMYFLILSFLTTRDYYRRFQIEQSRSTELKIALADSQLKALKMQLQPHFLFNTLNSISALMHEDLSAADSMVARLGDFLRLTLDNSGEQVVTLQKEMNFVNGYLEIESVRFAERLTIEREIEPETLAARVPNLILQPIVENAIQHGISRQIKPGKIRITARRSADKLQLQVEDNGIGWQNGKTAPVSGIGLANTRARLRHIYNGSHRLEISEAAPHGVIVTVEVPFETAE